MKSLIKVFLLLLLFWVSNISFGQTFSCSTVNGFHELRIRNPNAVDSDDGTVDGNCEYVISFQIFSFVQPIIFTYVGSDNAVPTDISVTNTFDPFLNMTITAPCGNLDVSFDLMDNNGNDVCVIRNVFMPVELINFQAKAIESGIRLNWETASEINNAGFELERSTDSKIWDKIVFIEGHLTTLSSQQYEFIDNKPKANLLYYRLKQIDTDGQFEYSSIISVKQYEERHFHIFPNPAAERIEINILKKQQYQEVEFWIFNSLGKVVKHNKLNSNILNINDLPKGLYQLSIKVKNQVYASHFIKE